MANVYIFLADGFEEIEGLTVVDLLRRAQINITMVSISDHKEVTGSHGICLQADTTFAEADFSDADMLVLPGGMPGTRHLGAHEGLTALLKEAKAAGKWVCAICAAPSVLGDLGLLKGEKASCYPGFEEHLTGAEVSYDAVSVSGKTITSRGMGTAIPFALEIIAQLKDAALAEQLSKGIIYTV